MTLTCFFRGHYWIWCKDIEKTGEMVLKYHNKSEDVLKITSKGFLTKCVNCGKTQEVWFE